MRDMVLFRGNPTVERSVKKAFQKKVVKKEKDDQQTMDEKKYLDPELFEILKQLKKQEQQQAKHEDDKTE